jgi:2-dehydro-3-deoxygluconokinase
MSRLLTIGETMGVAATHTGDPLRTARELRLSTAGAESTVAIGMRRLGQDAAWVGVVGDDELGARVRRDLAAEGVDVRFVRTDPDHPTGFMIRELPIAGLTRVTYYRQHSAGSQLSPTDVETAMAAGADLLHLTGITPALGGDCAEAVRCAVTLARRAGIPVSFDVNHRSTLPGSQYAAAFARELLADIDILFAGDDELAMVTDETDPERAARALLRRGPSEVVVKQGADGALAATTDGDLVAHPALAVPVVDVIGAGDSFTAGYLAARCEGRPVQDRLRWASAAAACTVSTHGDWEGLPTRAGIEHRSGRPATLR